MAKQRSAAAPSASAAGKANAAAAAASAAASSSSAAKSAHAATAASSSRGIMLFGVVAAVVIAVALSQSSLFSPSTSSSFSAAAAPAADGSLLPSPPHWGTYRPGLYLGVRGTWGSSPLFGWAWSCATAGAAGCGPMDQIQSLRHDAEERDGVTKYGWLQHNGGDYGVQGVLDRKMGVNFTTSFVQPRNASTGSSSGAPLTDRWAVRIEAHAVGATAAGDAAAAKSASPQTVSLFFYTALADASHSVKLLSQHSKTGIVGDGSGDDAAVAQKVYAGPEAGEIVVRSGVASSGTGTAAPKVRTYFHGTHIDESPPPPQRRNQAPPPPQQFTWAAKENIQRVLTDSYRPAWTAHSARVQAAQRAHAEKHNRPAGKQQHRPPAFVPPVEKHFVPTLPNIVERNANFLVIQHVITLPFTMDFVLQPAAEDERLQSDSGASDTAEVGRTDRWFAAEAASSSPVGSAGAGASRSVSLASALAARSSEFDERFSRTFRISPIGTSPSSPANTNTHSQKEFAQSLLANLLGGIGFFHGRQLVEESPAVLDRTGAVTTPARVVETEESSLLSCVPSRSFFPRGFMWDEGFHQLLVSRWSLGLSLRSLESWFGQIKATSLPVGGWMPREQILGEEARRRVPKEFQAQKPWVANPPTMLLALERVLHRLRRGEREALLRLKQNGGDGSEIESAQTAADLELFTRFLVRWLPTLHSHVSWFFRTQASTASGALPQQLGAITLSGSMPPLGGGEGELPLAFRWAGRTLQHCLASGLDDYPRAEWLPTMKDKAVPAASAGTATPTPAQAQSQSRAQAQVQADRAAGRESLVASVGPEGHVDLHAWMALLAQTMAGLMEYAGEHVGKVAGQSAPGTQQQQADGAINYAQVAAAYRTYSTSLKSSLISLHWDNATSSFADWAYRGGSRRFLAHKGYVSLMPLFLGVVDGDSPQLEAVLRALQQDRWGLRSPGGLRSLSGKDKLFGSGEDYWRGHVWVNMQFLAVDALARYARDERASPSVRQMAAEMGRELRQTVANNVRKEYARTGFVWEQYNALDGTGRKSHPFTGWTALTLLIMDEQE